VKYKHAATRSSLGETSQEEKKGSTPFIKGKTEGRCPRKRRGRGKKKAKRFQQADYLKIARGQKSLESKLGSSKKKGALLGKRGET